MTLRFVALPTGRVRELQAGAADDFGLMPERHISDGGGVPCRHCLRHVAAGEAYLVLAYRPFPVPQPYAETGPIFLHADPCPRAEEGGALPPISVDTPEYIVRGYGADDRIVYGTGAVTPTQHIAARAAELFRRTDVDYLHVRSARNNCYQFRIERG
ncbi:MAG: DUF1203 domain-containing protein [Rhizobiaceae bacterium]|nr:MAG: DUF1203 domain-containing protein [Rhizobiaceae bacterium]CAG0973444.1 hypothetical protein RHIZO_01348 [Rhizobiaceae bacterium]